MLQYGSVLFLFRYRTEWKMEWSTSSEEDDNNVTKHNWRSIELPRLSHTMSTAEKSSGERRVEIENKNIIVAIPCTTMQEDAAKGIELCCLALLHSPSLLIQKCFFLYSSYV